MTGEGAVYGVPQKNAAELAAEEINSKGGLLGKKVIILNSERAIVTGRKKASIEHYQEKRGRKGSSQKEPLFPKLPERIVKRTIRNMLPDFRRGRGREAFKRILCFKGVPEEYKEAEAKKSGKEKHARYMNIEQISKKI